jgi:hypothetical protein
MAACMLVIGNLWLLGALALVLGRHLARTEPTMYSFLQSGAWFYPETYDTWIILCVLAALVHFVVSYRIWRKRQ